MLKIYPGTTQYLCSYWVKNKHEMSHEHVHYHHHFIVDPSPLVGFIFYVPRLVAVTDLYVVDLHLVQYSLYMISFIDHPNTTKIQHI